jgi:hypothetical protein
LQTRKEPYMRRKKKHNKQTQRKKNSPFSHAKVVIIATYTSKARRNTIVT